ncbi:MAG: DUF4276 family protein [Polyangiaceae bacterium]|nr:DUF4276 family protein [Polyangiaceae bacterium]
MKILVYVEGRADAIALESLLKPVTEVARRNRRSIRFLGLTSKAEVLTQAPRKAASELRGAADAWVFALPDLYPSAGFNDALAHRTRDDLLEVLVRSFRRRCSELGVPAERRDRFRAHCLKHDLEALLLASPAALRARLKTSDALSGRWRLPVEDQNQDRPPKKVVDELFNKYRRTRYVDTTEALWILSKASLDDLVSACAESFAPFVRELRALAEHGTLEAST